MGLITKQEALDYHSKGRAGKIEVIPTKSYSTQKDLSLAYTPGVAEPCREIEKKPEDVYKYTAKGNLVAVISNGTAVLGLGDIGAAAGKPVMEGKGLLFKVFSDVDVFDIEINEKNPDKIIEIVKAISPTFGGINLEDIKAPECFEIEKRLIDELDIPVFHDDQHGTAIISGAALINALELANKKIDEIVVVVNGAGASAIACSKFYVELGVKKENIIMFDTKGPITVDRTDINKYKREFATNKNVQSLEEALEGADVFLGLSIGGVLKPEMIKKMADNPIIFALANPDPEILYEDAVKARPDVIMATGRSDYPNQVNNVLGFPFIFRGALDVHAKKINTEMKIAAAKALAELAKESVPEEVVNAYNVSNLMFGKEYIIPKPLDPRLITRVAPAVAKAAIETGVARKIITDWQAYITELETRMGLDNKLIRSIRLKAQSFKDKPTIVFAEGEYYKVLKAVHEIVETKVANAIVLGRKDKIENIAKDYGIDISKIKILNPLKDEFEAKRKEFAFKFWKKRQRKGLTYEEALKLMNNYNHFGLMMVENQEADAFISGYATKYRNVMSPALQIIGKRDDVNVIAGLYIVQTKKGLFFLADTTINTELNAEKLACIARLTAEEVKKFGIEPIIAMLSYTNFGSVKNNDVSQKVADAVKLLHEKHPNLAVDGDIQANIALDNEIRDNLFPFSKLYGKQVNTLIFPDLTSGNIAYKLLNKMANAELIGPITLGLKKAVHVIQINSSIQEITNIATIAAIDAITRK